MTRLQLPSLKTLPVFEAAGRLGSFSQAALELHVTQSAVSRQISLLEETLGCRLFVRGKMGTRLTEFGSDYHTSVSASLNDLSAATDALKLKIAGLSIVRVSTLPSLAMHWLLPQLTEFKVAHPEIAIDLSVSNELVDLANGTIHVGIRFGEGQWNGLISEHLFDEELVTVCAPTLAGGFAGDISAGLRETPKLHTTTRPNAWREWIETHHADPESLEIPDAGFQDFFITIQAAVLGHGIAVVPSFLVEQELADGRLIEPTKRRVTSKHSYYFVTSREIAKRAPVRQFKDWLLQICQEP